MIRYFLVENETDEKNLEKLLCKNGWVWDKPGKIKNYPWGVVIDDDEGKVRQYFFLKKVPKPPKIAVGDEVRITSVGGTYTTYWSFFNDNELPYAWAAKYAYGSKPDLNEKYNILWIDEMNDILVITSSTHAVYLIKKDCVEVV